MSENLLDEVRQTIADVFALNVDEVSAAATADSTPAWDSINHLNLILALEQRFGISFDPEQIPAVTSVQALADAVAAKKG